MKNDLICSFCGKSQYEVEWIVVGPAVYICIECVNLCLQIIQDVRIERTAQAARETGFKETYGTD